MPYTLHKRLVLADDNPERLQLLQAQGLVCEQEAGWSNEDQHPGESPKAYVQRLAKAKALSVYSFLDDQSNVCVLGLDSVLLCGDLVQYKPRNSVEAGKNLLLLSGKTLSLLTSYVLLFAPDDVHVTTVTTDIFLGEISPEAIKSYLGSTEFQRYPAGLDLAGSGGEFILKTSGSPVLSACGLPLDSLLENLKKQGVIAA